VNNQSNTSIHTYNNDNLATNKPNSTTVNETFSRICGLKIKTENSSSDNLYPLLLRFYYSLVRAKKSLDGNQSQINEKTSL